MPLSPVMPKGKEVIIVDIKLQVISQFQARQGYIVRPKNFFNVSVPPMVTSFTFGSKWLSQDQMLKRFL